MNRITLSLALLATALSFASLSVASDEVCVDFSEDVECCAVDACQDRVFVVSTRHLTSNPCTIDLERPAFRVSRVECGRQTPVDLKTLEVCLASTRPVVVYVHGNRMPCDELLSRFIAIKNAVRACRRCGGVDWLVFSWPSDTVVRGLSDFRIKADRCDAQGLYLGWLLRRQLQVSHRVVMIGYSFGARVATGSLHAIAGGALAGRCLPGEPMIGGDVHLGLIAPAIESHWLGLCGYHGESTKNMDELSLLYNHRDAVLKRYWIIDQVRNRTALGYTGPVTFAPRADGSRLPVRARDFAPNIKFRHSELDYYENKKANAAAEVARLIHGIPQVQRN